jgi:hypothetical protein
LFRRDSIPGPGQLADAQDPLGRQVERDESQQNGYGSERSGVGREHRKKMRGDGLTLEQDSILEYYSRTTSFDLRNGWVFCSKASHSSGHLGLFHFSGLGER